MRGAPACARLNAPAAARKRALTLPPPPHPSPLATPTAGADSDGDGWPNGWELGDPCGEWSYRGGGHPLWGNDISHPGNASSVPTTRPLDWQAVCGCNPCDHPDVHSCSGNLDAAAHAYAGEHPMPLPASVSGEATLAGGAVGDAAARDAVVAAVRSRAEAGSSGSSVAAAGRLSPVEAAGAACAARGGVGCGPTRNPPARTCNWHAEGAGGAGLPVADA